MTNKLVAVMQDLMFMVRIQEIAKRAGVQTIVVKTREAALQQAAAQPLLMVIDLNYDAGEPLRLIGDLKNKVFLLAFVSHVQVELRAAAVAAGCDLVVARSAFAQTLPEVLNSCLPK